MRNSSDPFVHRQRESRLIEHVERLLSDDRLRIDTTSGRRAVATLRRDVRKQEDRKSTRLNSSHLVISYAVFCLKKKNHEAASDPHVFLPIVDVELRPQALRQAAIYAVRTSQPS